MGNDDNIDEREVNDEEGELDEISEILSKQSISLDEMLKLIGYGYVLRKSPYYHIKSKTLYLTIINTLTEDIATVHMHVEPRDKDKIIEKIKSEMKEKWGRVMYKRKVRSSEGEHEQAESDEEDNQKKNKGLRVKSVLTESSYDKNFAKQIAIISGRNQWFTKLIDELGARVLFIVLQMADIPPEHMYDKLSEYANDPEAFLEFAEPYLIALFEAKKDAESLLELRERYKLKDAEVELWKIRYAKALKALRDLNENMQALMGMLNRKQMERYMLYLALKSAANAVEYEDEGMRIEERDEDGQRGVHDDGEES